MPEYSAILFGGVPTVPSPEVFERARKSNPAWYQALEKAYAVFAARPENAGVYADPKGKGATLQQTWLVFTLFGVEPYCLLARQVPTGQTQRITRLVQSSADQIIGSLMKIGAAEGRVVATTLHYDGKTGHCITVTDYDEARDRFIYHDPWPERSLLCKENNMAGVDAQPEGTRWSVTSKELERVMFASFVFPSSWARIQGVDFDLMYDAWKESEFFKFFHFKPIAERAEDGVTRRMFAPGPFKDTIALIVDSEESGKIVKASLILNKQWMAGNIVLALDLSKSFVASFAPRPDAETYDSIARALWNLKDPAFAVAMKDKDPDESVANRCVHAFAGSVESASVTTDLGHLSFQNLVHEKEHVLEIVFTLS